MTARLQRSEAQRPEVGIVHLGPGAFFRAFGAVYTAEAMAQAGGDWGITGVSLRSPDIRDALMPQGCAYTSVTLSPQGAQPDVIEVIDRVLVAPEDPEAVIFAMADPKVQIISLTVTEKGYCLDPATGELNTNHADVVYDLAHPQTPRSAVGFIVAALARRRLAGQAAFTVLSCDNLPGNGALTRGVVLAFARHVSLDLADWIAAKARFPATMVDRITPATTQDDIARLSEQTGVIDHACVLHEPFRQWVIEDDFAGAARPAWDTAGAQLVADVAPFETMKLRCLNGTHSALAYLGYLAGYETIADTVADPAFAAFTKRLWADEIVPTIRVPEGEDLPRYCDDLLARYRNPAIRHRTWQIAMDGSQKLPQRLLGTIADNLATGRGISRLALAVAAWMRYVGGVDEAGQGIDVRDPLAGPLKAASDATDTPAGKVAALLAMRQIFPASLAQDPIFVAAVTDALRTLTDHGTKAAVATFTQSPFTRTATATRAIRQGRR